MDIHKPKPWHGLREFLKEYVIIVVGVLTALGAEQAVEWLRNRAEAAEARDALHQEITANARSLRYALAEDRCYLASMDHYIAWATGGTRPPPIIDAVSFPSTTSSVWDIARAGAVTHMPLKERMGYANFYAFAGNHLTLVAHERDGAAIVGRYAYLDRLTPQEARTLLQEISAMRPFLRIKVKQDAAVLQQAIDLGARMPPMAPEAHARLESTCRLAGTPLTE